MKLLSCSFFLAFVFACNLGCSRLMPPPQASAGEIKASGFLGSSYKLLRPGDGEKGQYAALVYANPAAKVEKYKKVILDPVSVWGSPKANYDGMSREEVQDLVNIFYNELYAELSKDYQMVQKPGPGTMRIQVALTQADESKPVMDLVSTVVPFARAAAEARQLAVGNAAFVGDATIEGKITDASSGELLWAGADKRYGQKRIEKGFDAKADVKYLFAYWAKAMRFRLCEKSGHLGCVKP